VSSEWRGGARCVGGVRRRVRALAIDGVERGWMRRRVLVARGSAVSGGSADVMRRVGVGELTLGTCRRCRGWRMPTSGIAVEKRMVTTVGSGRSRPWGRARWWTAVLGIVTTWAFEAWACAR